MDINSTIICTEWEKNCELFFKYKFLGYGFTFVELVSNEIVAKLDTGMNIQEDNFINGKFTFNFLNSSVNLRDDKITIEWIINQTENYTFAMNYYYY